MKKKDFTETGRKNYTNFMWHGAWVRNVGGSRNSGGKFFAAYDNNMQE